MKGETVTNANTVLGCRQLRGSRGGAWERKKAGTRAPKREKKNRGKRKATWGGPTAKISK